MLLRLSELGLAVSGIHTGNHPCPTSPIFDGALLSMGDYSYDLHILGLYLFQCWGSIEIHIKVGNVHVQIDKGE